MSKKVRKLKQLRVTLLLNRGCCFFSESALARRCKAEDEFFLCSRLMFSWVSLGKSVCLRAYYNYVFIYIWRLCQVVNQLFASIYISVHLCHAPCTVSIYFDRPNHTLLYPDIFNICFTCIYIYIYIIILSYVFLIIILHTYGRRCSVSTHGCWSSSPRLASSGFA